MRLVTCLAALALACATVHAEVSVDRTPAGIRPYFQPGVRGPWQRVRPEVAPPDILNELGDNRGDGWPVIRVNAGNALPDVVWPSADGEILYSRHDGTSWTVPLDLSRNSCVDAMPALTTDDFANRFVAWDHARSNDRHSVYFTALSGDVAGQTDVRELSSRPRQGRRPSLRVYLDDLVYVGYEEASGPSDDTPSVALDQVRVGRLPSGMVALGGAGTIDIARSCTIRTHLRAAQPAEVRVETEAGHLWITWIDSDTLLGWSEVTNGGCGPAHYDPLDSLQPERARELVRFEILGY